MTASADSWDVITDCVIVGSGGGSMCAALALVDAGYEALILEKTESVGGSTAMSAGVMWLPDNKVSRAAGAQDSREQALRYFESTVGHDLPSTSIERTNSFLGAVDPMITFLEKQGMKFRPCIDYPDYYDERPGGSGGARSIEAELFDIKKLGPWRDRLRVNEMLPPLAMYSSEYAPATLSGRTLRSLSVITKVAGRTLRGVARRQALRGSGTALQGWLLHLAVQANVPIWTSTSVSDLIIDDTGAVIGVVAFRNGKSMRIRARRGVLLNSGGFALSESMRQKYSPQPASTDWSMANPGDTGEVLQAAIRAGAATDLMDEAWWMPMSTLPDGTRLFSVYERSKPHAIMVDSGGQRFVNEAASYMEVGKAMYERNSIQSAVPSWFIMDSRNRKKYVWGKAPGGLTPKKWISERYMIKADTLDELARECGIDSDGLRTTVDRYNTHAAGGKDPEFQKGERGYDRYYGDPQHGPNPCVGTVEKGPFYAVALYPGDLGTCGGVLTDEHAQVLDAKGNTINGLYATGNCSATLMGRMYPGAGATVSASFVFGWIAAQSISRLQAVPETLIENH